MFQKKNKKIISCLIVFGFIFLPIVFHANSINLRQYDISTFRYFIISQLLIGFIVFNLSILFDKLIMKKKYFDEILISNFLIFYLFFYYTEILGLYFVHYLDGFYYLLDNLASLVIYLIIYLISFYSLKKFNQETKTFFIVFIFINFLVGINNMDFFNSTEKNKSIKYDSTDRINLNKIKPSKSEKNIKVYLIVLDGMINLEKAFDNKIISSIKEIENKLNKSGYNYHPSFNSNYPRTYASVTSLLYGDYPVTENSNKYMNNMAFFPNIMTDKENYFYQIINKLNMTFFWIGNQWRLCDGSEQECAYNYGNKSIFLSKLVFYSENLYKNSILKYFFESFQDSNIHDAYNFLKNKNKKTLKENLNKNEFYFIHVMKPHPPYNLDKKCNELKNELTGPEERILYGYNYNCALNAVLEWDKNFVEEKDQNMIIILGDHGWILDKNKNEIDNVADKLNNIFFAYKTPEKCKHLDLPNSHVNVMRFILNCVNESQFDYLDDNQYTIRYEDHKDYGLAIKILDN